jgi:hypothetical protein
MAAPDHYARLTTGKHFRDFLAAGRPAPKHPEKQEQGRMTLDELRRLVEAADNLGTDWNAVV